jgi:DNA-directed RNA polymerase subunit RPC12/RpoP
MAPTPPQEGYRQAPERCAVCGEEAYGRCGRCGRTFCLAHFTTTDEQRCPDCELHFSGRAAKIRRVAGSAAAVAGTAAAVGALVASAPVLLLIGSAAAGAAAGAALVARLASRRRFLKEGPQHEHGMLEGARVRISGLTDKLRKGRAPMVKRARTPMDVNKYRSGGLYGR